MRILYILQAVVPLALIAWVLFAPQRSAVGFWLQALSIGIGLVALALTGLLLFPPWWAPLAFALLLIVAIFISLRRRPLTTISPRGAVAWFFTMVFGAFLIFCANQIRIAYTASQPPPGQSIDLASPLGAGRYLIINGGTSTALNAHADALDQSIVAHRAFYGTSYGVDIVAIDRFGLRADGIMPTDPTRYRIFGKPVLAPCAGTVIAAVDGLPDMDVPELDKQHLAGNHIILRCDGLDILLAHFQRSSVDVRLGANLMVGAPVANVGNSGVTSEPHLHIHAQRLGTKATPFSGMPIPLRISGRFLVRNTQFDVLGKR